MEEVSRILNEQPPTSITLQSIPPDDKRYDRLSAVVAGGNLKKYFCKEYTMSEINYTLDTKRNLDVK